MDYNINFVLKENININKLALIMSFLIKHTYVLFISAQHTSSILFLLIKKKLQILFKF